MRFDEKPIWTRLWINFWEVLYDFCRYTRCWIAGHKWGPRQGNSHHYHVCEKCKDWDS